MVHYRWHRWRCHSGTEALRQKRGSAVDVVIHTQSHLEKSALIRWSTTSLHCNRHEVAKWRQATFCAWTFAVLNIGICRARTNNSCAEMACSQRVGTGKIPFQTTTTSPWHIDLGAAAEAAKLSLKMFESSRAVFSLSPSRKISEPSRASHKNFHLNFFHGNDDDTGKTFRILKEVAAYLGSTVRDRNSGIYGFLDVINFTYCHTLQSQQGCLRLRELRDVTNCVIISSNQIPFYEWETHKLSTLNERHNLTK